MFQSRPCSLFVLVILLARLSSGGEDTISKSVCLMESIQLFQKISSVRITTLYSRIINGSLFSIMPMARWSGHTCVIQEQCNDKFRLDEDGRMWMRNAQLSDERIYFLNYRRNMEVQINVMVPPSTDCKPIIERVESRLCAFLKGDCGKPVASVYFLGYKNQDCIQVLPGKEEGAYHACLEGPSLKCVSSVSDYCSTFRVDAENILRMTSSIDQDQDTAATDIPYLTYVIPGTADLAFILGVVLCCLKKYIHRPGRARVSNINQNAHSDTGDGNQEETLAQHYWTIGINTRGIFSTVLERDINVELVEFIEPAHTDLVQSDETMIANDENHQEEETYPLNTDRLEISSVSAELEEYIDPVPSDPMRLNEYLDLLPSDPVECDEYIHPVPSDPMDLGGYVDPITSDRTGLNEYLDIIPSDPVECNESIHPAPSDPIDLGGYIDPIHSDAMRLNEYLELIPLEPVECNDYIHPIPSNPLDHASYIDPIPSDSMRRNEDFDIIPLDPVEYNQYIHPVPSDPDGLHGYDDPTPSDSRRRNPSID